MSTANFANLLRNFRGGTDLVHAVGTRMRQERDAAGFTQADAASRLGISGGYLSELEAGKKAPTLHVLEGICSWRGRSLEWLLFGEEADEDGSSSLAEAVELVINHLGGHSDEPVGEGELRAAVGEVMAAYQARNHSIRLAVTRRAAANPRSRVAWEPVEGVAVTIPGDAIAVEVVGDSMEPVALDGQVAVFVAAAPSHGDLAYVELRDGRSFFKRAWIYKKEWVLVSVSPRPGEEPIVVPARQVARAFRWKGTLARD